MPKNKRGKRKRKLWRGIEVGIENKSSMKIEKELKVAKGDNPVGYYIDKTSGNHNDFHPIQKKEIARAKVLSLEKRLNPYPHIKTTGSIQKKKRSPTGRYLALLAKKNVKPLIDNKDNNNTNSGSDKSKETESNKDKEFYDLWKPKEDPFKKLVEEFPAIETEYLEPDYTPNPPPYKSPSSVPAIEIPHPGTSYNPNPNEYLQLLKSAIDEQVKERKKLRKVINALKAEKIKHPVNEVDNIEELNEEEEEEEEEEEKEKVFRAHIPRLTKSDRNKLAKKKRTKILAKLKKEEEERLEQLKKLEEFEKEIIEKEEKIKLKLLRSEEKKIEDMSKTKKLGSEVFIKPDIDVLLPEQLPGRLANYTAYKNGINPFRDRLASVQKRNILEYRSRKKNIPKYTPKYMEKYGYKFWTRDQEKKYMQMK